MLQHRIVALVMIVSGGILTYPLPSLAGEFHSRNSYRHSQSQVSFSTDVLPSTLALVSASHRPLQLKM